MLNEKIFVWFNRYIWHGRSGVKKRAEMMHEHLEEHEVIVFGYGSMGSHLSHVLQEHDIGYAVIDHNPAMIKVLKNNDTDYIFADATNVDAYKHLFGKSVRMCVSTLRDLDDNISVIKTIKRENDNVVVVAMAHHHDEALVLYKE